MILLVRSSSSSITALISSIYDKNWHSFFQKFQLSRPDLSDNEILDYAGRSDKEDLKKHVDNILIERVPDTEGSKKVRNVSVKK